MEVLDHYIIQLKLILYFTLTNWNLNKNIKKIPTKFREHRPKSIIKSYGSHLIS